MQVVGVHRVGRCLDGELFERDFLVDVVNSGAVRECAARMGSGAMAKHGYVWGGGTETMTMTRESPRWCPHAMARGSHPTMNPSGGGVCPRWLFAWMEYRLQTADSRCSQGHPRCAAVEMESPC